jgi:hypothetical protein
MSGLRGTGLATDGQIIDCGAATGLTSPALDDPKTAHTPLSAIAARVRQRLLSDGGKLIIFTFTSMNGCARNPRLVIESVAVNLVDERSMRGEICDGLLCEPF